MYQYSDVLEEKIAMHVDLPPSLVGVNESSNSAACFAYFSNPYYPSTIHLLQVDQNQNGQQVGLKVSSHERFKHTFYPALTNQDSYANSISDCLARDSFGNKISKERQSKTNMDREINF